MLGMSNPGSRSNDEKSNSPTNYPAPLAMSASERLTALREKLEEARGENLKAVEDEGKCRHTFNTRGAGVDVSLSEDDAETVQGDSRARPRRFRKRQRKSVEGPDVGSADEGDGEDDNARLRSMKRRARSALGGLRREPAEPAVLQYGVTGSNMPAEDVDRMVNELKRVDKRREKFRRRRVFDEDRSDITFINEGNRLFNRALDKHFDKFESVKEIKDSLERGTA